MVAIKVRALSKSFRGYPVLRDVTFDVPEGRVAGFLGPNGAGKTTTLKVLIGLLRRDRGLVEVLGLDPWEEGMELRERVGVLHEKPLYPRGARVSTLLRYVARLRGRSYREALEAAKATGVADYLEQPVASLSRGYLQRLGIALALIGDPELLLLDEPTANLDPLARMRLLNLVRALHKDLGVTVVVSSHIIPELSLVCDYAVFIAGGRTLEWGSMEELAKKYGVSSTYRIRAAEPRALARELIGLSYVSAVEVGEGAVKVRVEGGYVDAFLRELDTLGRAYQVKWIAYEGGELAPLYERIVVSRGVAS